MSEKRMKVSLLVIISLAIIAISMVTVVMYAQPNKKGLGIASNGVDDSKNFEVQKMIRYRYLPPGKGLGLIKNVELSEEFKNNILDILGSNENTSKLLDEGYEVTLIRPIIKLVVLGDGSVVLKVVEVQVTLYKKGEGVFQVLIDYEAKEVVNIFGQKYCKCASSTS